MNKKIIIISGDPNSINSEIIYKCWKNLKSSVKKNIFLISNYNLIKQQFKILRYPIKLIKIKKIDDKINTKDLKILDVELKFNKPFNVSVKSAKLFIKKSLNLGHYEALKKDVAGIINCPINKELLQKKNQGVTEFLSSKCNIKDGSEVMLIKSKKTSVAPITTHLDLKNVPKKISSKLIIKKIITINSWFKKIYKKKPRLAILGLNPHNAEMKKDSEEIKKIIPAIKKLKKIGIKVTGPLVADTVFMNEYKNFDVIVGMYHDQVLPSFKSIFKFDAINITLGIKYLRLSPDHGVAKNIMKKKIANYMSLLKCIEFLQKFK